MTFTLPWISVKVVFVKPVYLHLVKVKWLADRKDVEVWCCVLRNSSVVSDATTFLKTPWVKCHSLNSLFTRRAMSGCSALHVNNMTMPQRCWINHTMKAQSGTEGRAPHSLNLDTRWGWVVSFKLREWDPPVPKIGDLSEPQSRSGLGEKDNKSYSCRECNPGGTESQFSSISDGP
jgi:hypothetical protein